jgi:hypothetical protein
MWNARRGTKKMEIFLLNNQWEFNIKLLDTTPSKKNGY